jgi:hypothetical protein
MTLLYYCQFWSKASLGERCNKTLFLLRSYFVTKTHPRTKLFWFNVISVRFWNIFASGHIFVTTWISTHKDHLVNSRHAHQTWMSTHIGVGVNRACGRIRAGGCHRVGHILRHWVFGCGVHSRPCCGLNAPDSVSLWLVVACRVKPCGVAGDDSRALKNPPFLTGWLLLCYEYCEVVPDLPGCVVYFWRAVVFYGYFHGL